MLLSVHATNQISNLSKDEREHKEKSGKNNKFSSYLKKSLQKQKKNKMHTPIHQSFYVFVTPQVKIDTPQRNDPHNSIQKYFSLNHQNSTFEVEV